MIIDTLMADRIIAVLAKMLAQVLVQKAFELTLWITDEGEVFERLGGL